MAEHAVQPLEQSLYHTYQWIDEVCAGLGTHDEERGYQALRASLHAIRDRLLPSEAAQMAAQLPTVLRGVYYEGWDPDDRPFEMRSGEAFVALIARDLPPGNAIDPQDALRASVEVLRRRISSGEVADVLNMLPGDVRTMAGVPAWSSNDNQGTPPGDQPPPPVTTGLDWALDNLRVSSLDDLERHRVNVFYAPNVAIETKVVNLANGRVVTFARGEERPQSGFFAEYDSVERHCRREGIPLEEVNGQLSASALAGEAGDPLHHPG